jgi:hypothetical protein
MAKLNDFISQVKHNGMARTNRYVVYFSLPWEPDSALRDTLLFCDQVQIPGTNFNTSDMRTFGETRKAPYERLYEDINMSFYVDKEMKNKLMFDYWFNQIQNPWTRNFNYYDTYKTDIVIEVQDLKDQSRYGIKLFEAYPKSMGAIQLDYAGKDVMKISVNFAYKYYHIGSKEVLEPPDVAPVYEYPAVQTARDPLNSFVNRLKNFAVGAIGSKVVSKLPQILKR